MVLYSHTLSETLVMPFTPANFAIPSPNDPDLEESTVLICGILPDTTAFIPTWTAPNGVSFTPDDLADPELGRKYMIQNGRLGLNFPQGSILIVMRLSYLDSGNYTCSVEFNDSRTGGAEFQLTLLGKCIDMSTELHSNLTVTYNGQDCSVMNNWVWPINRISFAFAVRNINFRGPISLYGCGEFHLQICVLTGPKFLLIAGFHPGI